MLKSKQQFRTITFQTLSTESPSWRRSMPRRLLTLLWMTSDWWRLYHHLPCWISLCNFPENCHRWGLSWYWRNIGGDWYVYSCSQAGKYRATTTLLDENIDAPMEKQYFMWSFLSLLLPLVRSGIFPQSVGIANIFGRRWNLLLFLVCWTLQC